MKIFYMKNKLMKMIKIIPIFLVTLKLDIKKMKMN